jgi:hypothetical protein
MARHTFPALSLVLLVGVLIVFFVGLVTLLALAGWGAFLVVLWLFSVL